jgi:hypothetical protein
VQDLYLFCIYFCNNFTYCSYSCIYRSFVIISSQNVDTRLYSSRRLAYFMISISVFFWIVFNFHILVKVNIQQFSPSDFVCYYNLSKSSYSSYTTSTTKRTSINEKERFFNYFVVYIVKALFFLLLVCQ